MINNKDAIRAVIGYMKDLSEFMPSTDERLEEIELDDPSKEWLVTVSFRENAIFADPRIYKRFAVDSEKGEVKSMHDRN